jgi:translation initiation factor eIF-2B subunit delta
MQTTSPIEFRREMFRVGWMFLCERRAVAALVNVISTMQWALERVSTVAEMQAVVPLVVADIRHQLNQRVLDTAAHSLSVLSNTQRIITYGYSTTVQYALQHALRNGQRTHVTCMRTAHAHELTALVERIAAIGLSVDTCDIHTLAHSIKDYDAVMVGADTLDTYGLSNKNGTAELVAHAYAHNVPVFTLCTSEKLLSNDFYHGNHNPWPLHHTPQYITTTLTSENDSTPLTHITSIVTDRGALPAPAVEAWLATAQLHPWLSGRGTL